MRDLLATRIAGQEDAGRDLVEFAFGSLTAEPVANAFFAASRTLAELDGHERDIETRLRKTILAEITRRNDLLHGDWYLDEMGADDTPRAVLLRVKAGSTQQPFRFHEYNAQQIEAIWREVAALHDVIWVFAEITLKPHGDENTYGLPMRVREALEIENGHVALRSGIARPLFHIS
jgi:hypothetical protein